MSDTGFIAVRSAGGLLPVDTLTAVVEGKGLDGLTPSDFHLLPGETLRGEANRAWQRLLGAWRVFQDGLDSLPEGDPAIGVTRERWLLPLFTELGYGRLDTTPAGGLEVDGRAFAVSHLWRTTPIHLLGAGVDLDRRSSGVAGAARAAPHAMVQELLNRTDNYLWAFLSNGRTLRVLRDNAALVRQAHLDFDLVAIFDGELFSEFVALFLVCHQSRLEVRDETGLLSCWLETWRTASVAAGTRALDHLRDGVVSSLRAFGSGFLRHPANSQLRSALASGELTPQDYYRALLRLAYRLLFVFVAEDRNLLHDPDANAQARDRYARFFSTARLRRLATRARSADRHPDLWQSLQLVFDALGDPEGLPALGLPNLGGFLFDPATLGPLRGAQLANADLLAALRPLALVRDPGGLTRTIDYRNLDSEELGSVYESLLQLVPQHDPASGEFTLVEIAGNERKTTGSYYTPSSLIASLLDTALDPLLDDAVTSAADAQAAEAALLRMTICDPACGSGHFLVAAARRIAKRLAAVRTGDPEPAPEALRTALRDVVGHCIYGVDLNDLAAELAKVSLWLEALEPGKPLSFLDAKIKVGNALLGATPALLARGIPDEAFAALTGDDKKLTAALKKRNKRERQSVDQGGLFAASDLHRGTATIAARWAEVEQYDDSSPAGLAARANAWRRLEASPELRQARFIADAWCAAFVWPRIGSATPAITDGTFRELEAAPNSASAQLSGEVARLANDYRFFHWYLEFPEIFTVPNHLDDAADPDSGWSGGFDLLVGNPPWDSLSPDRKEFFSVYDPKVRFLSKNAQDALIAELLQAPEVARRWTTHQRDLYALVHFVKKSGRYRLFAPGNLGKGDFNVYRMFVESAMQLVLPGGRVTQILPGGFYGGANAMAIRKELFERWRLIQVLGFINTGEHWFQGVDATTRFCSYVGVKGGETTNFDVAFELRTPADLARAVSGAATKVSVKAIQDQSPDALAIAETTGADDSALVDRMYSLWPKFGDATLGPPVRHYQREIDMGTDRERFAEYEAGLPLYEGRMIDRFDHRAKAWRSGRGRAAVWEELQFGDVRKGIIPQWRVPLQQVPNKLGDRIHSYRVGFGDVTSPRNERSLIAALIPPDVICGHILPTFVFQTGWEWAYMPWLAFANSFCMDYLLRKKVSLHVTFTALDSLPFPRLSLDHPIVKRVAPLALRLTCTAPEMTAYWNAMSVHGWCEPVADGTAPGILDQATRAAVLAEIDAIVARDVFGLSSDELEAILDTFPVLRRREERVHGEYRTKQLVLRAYGATAKRTGSAYQTVLEPPPGDGPGQQVP